MLPVVMRFLGPVVIYPYGLWLCVAVLAAWFVASRRALGADLRPKLEAAFVVVSIGALIGARVFFELHAGDARPVLALFWLHRGGLDLWGAWLGGLLALLLWCKAKAQDPAHWARVLSPCALIAIAIGRIGAFASGCDYGRLFSPQVALMRALSEHARWPSAVMDLSAGPPVWLAQVERQLLTASSTVSLPTHPVQLYEALLVALWLLVALLHFAPGKSMIDQPKIVLLGYSAIAFAAEWLRGDENRGLIGPSLHGPAIVWLSTVLFALSLGIVVRQLGFAVLRAIQVGAAFALAYGALTWPIGQLLQHAPEGGRMSLAQCAALLMAAGCGFGAGEKAPQTAA